MLRFAVRGALIIVGLYLAVVAYQLWSIQDGLRSAESTVGALSIDSLEGADGIRGVVDPVLRSIDDAATTADSPVLGALRPIPIVGEQVEGLRALTDQLAGISIAADDAVARVETALDATGDEGGRVALTAAAIDAVQVVQAEIAATGPVDARGLVGPLRGAARQLDTRLVDAGADLAELEDRLAVARDLLTGPTKVLVLAANNGEIRAGMGMHLSAGIVTIADGDFETSEFVSTTPLRHLTIGRADVPDELAAMYERIWDFGREWRTTSTSPNFPAVGEIFGDLAARTPIGEIDLLLSIDAPALGELLGATGPVTVEDRTITSDNAVDVLLRDNYLELGDPALNTERRELQSDVATAIFDAVTERDDVDVIDLAAGLASAAEGRHVLAWAPDEPVQDLVEALGADGELSERSLLVSFQNASASKRDYFTDTDVRVVPADPDATVPRRFRAIATLDNPVVEPTAPYFDSLNRLVPVGTHRAFVTFTLPDGVTDVDVVTGELSSMGTDGPTTVANLWLRVPEGTSGDVAIEFTVPDDLRSVEVIPSARIRPTTYRVGPVTVTDQAPASVPLPRVADVFPQEAKLVEASALVVFFSALVLWVHRSRRLAGPDPDLDAAEIDARLARALLVFSLALGFLGAIQ